MSHQYPLVPLGDVCRFVGGGTPSRKKPEYFAGDIPWATVKDFKHFRIADTEEHISEIAVADSATNIVEAGTVLLVSRVGLGKVAIAERKLAINQDIKGLTPAPHILSEYLFWFLLSRADEIKSMGAGATVKGIALPDIKAIQIPVPPLSEQRRIIDILSRAEGIVRLRREAQRKAAELIPGIFLEMFGDPATNPKGWPVETIGRLTSVQTGATPSRENPAYYSDAEIPWVKTGEVKGGIISETEEMISQIALSETNCKVFPVGTILVAMYGQGQTRGRSAVLGIPAASNQACAAILPSSNIDEAFLFCFLQTQYEQLRGMAHGGNQANLNLSMIKKLPIILPPLSAQKVYSENLDFVRSIQSQQSAATAKAEAAFAALLAQVFSGNATRQGLSA